MREILFRGKSKRGGEWFEGNYCKEERLIGEGFDHFVIEISRDSGTVEIIPETVGQFTGLPDKNGKKIFEGDILRFVAHGTCYTGKVHFLNGAFWVRCGFNVAIGTIVNKYKPEIIGNIHDNPELLNGGEKNGT